MDTKKRLKTIGWREILALPGCDVKKIKVKVDTGAKTSALHVTGLKIEQKGQRRIAHFKVHPNQKSNKPVYSCSAPLIEKRKVKSSTGHESVRPVVRMKMKLGNEEWVSEVTLTNRDVMGFRMLLGREALKGRFLVDSGKSFLAKKKTKKIRKKS